MRRLTKQPVSEDVLNAIKLMKTGTPLICFDLETTGLSKNVDRILSFSAIKVVWDNGTIRGERKLNTYINPGFHIPNEATKVNHITDEFISQYPDETVVLPVIRRFMGETPLLCGYNSNSFDIPFLNKTYERVFGESLSYCGKLDVMRMVKELYDMKQYKLEYVAHELGCDMDSQFHASMDDVIATCRILRLALVEYTSELPSDEIKERLSIRGVHHYYMSHMVNRVYIHTYPYSKTYYDVYRGEWKSDYEADMVALRKDVLQYVNAKDENEMIKLIKQKEDS